MSELLQKIYVFPILRTDRLLLRKLDFDDFPQLVRHANNKNISDYILNIPYPYREPDAAFRYAYITKGFNEKSRFVFAIIDKASEGFIGEVSLHLEGKELAQMGYWIAEDHWKNGYASEAVAAVVKFGFQRLGMMKIYASCHQQNIASQRVVERNDFELEVVKGNVAYYSLSNSH